MEPMCFNLSLKGFRKGARLYAQRFHYILDYRSVNLNLEPAEREELECGL